VRAGRAARLSLRRGGVDGYAAGRVAGVAPARGGGAEVGGRRAQLRRDTLVLGTGTGGSAERGEHHQPRHAVLVGRHLPDRRGPAIAHVADAVADRLPGLARGHEIGMQRGGEQATRRRGPGGEQGLADEAAAEGAAGVRSAAPQLAGELRLAGAREPELADQTAPRLWAAMSTRIVISHGNSTYHPGDGQAQRGTAQRRLAAAMTDALQKRGVPDLAASLAAELGLLAFKRAFARWSDPANQQELSELACQLLHELHAASAALT
jgi:hypothetical protein